MSSRERKRQARKKRKQRSVERAEDQTAPEQGEAANPAEANGSGVPETVEDIAAEAERRGVSKSEIRNEIAREALEPLEDDERPLVITLGAILSAAIALVTVGAYAVGAEVDGERPNAVQVFAPAVLFGVMCWGMLAKKHWAVLGFQAVMAILMVGAFLTLVSATSAAQALTAVAVLAVCGTFFWFTIKALARIQMPDRHMPR